MSESPKITKLAFERRYADDSGVEFGIRYDAGSLDNGIQFDRINTVEFPLDELDWLIDCLSRIRNLTHPNPEDTP